MNLTQILTMIVVGLFVGVVARLFMPGRDPGGFVVTTLLGIAGSFVGGYVFGVLGFYAHSLVARLITSILGAMILLWGYRLIAGGRRR